MVPGSTAFVLHDTQGFPIDLTLEMAAEAGLTVDTDEFRRLMEEQRQRARADAKARKGKLADLSVYRSLDAGRTEFTGYSELQTEGHVRGLILDGVRVPAAHSGQEVEVVLDRTPLYAESGGQDSDAGTIVGQTAASAEVLDVQKVDKKIIVHRVRVTDGELVEGAKVLAKVDPEWRLGARQAHSGHARGARGAAAGARAGGAAVRVLQQARLPAAGLRLEPGAVAGDPQRAGRGVQPGGPQGPAGAGAVRLAGRGPGDGRDRAVRRDLRRDGPDRGDRRALVRRAVRRHPRRALVPDRPDRAARRIVGGLGTAPGGGRGRHRGLPPAGRRAGAGQPAGRPRCGCSPTNCRAGSRRWWSGCGPRRRNWPVCGRPRWPSSAATLAAEAVTVGDVAVVAASAPEGTAAGDVRNLATDVRGRLGARPGVAAIFAPGEGSVAFSVALTPAAVAAGWSAGDLVKSFLPEIEGRGGGKKDMAQGAGTRPEGIPAAVTALQAAVARGNR